MILLHKFEPQISIGDKEFKILRQYDELIKIYDFIELPDSIQKIEQENSSILRNYYSNALDHNLLDIKIVKYIIKGNVRAKGLAERSVEQYQKASQWLSGIIDEPLSISMLYQLEKILILDLYNHQSENNLFSQRARSHEKLSAQVEQELQNVFDFLNNDSEWHPLIQAFVLHFSIMNLQLFSEAKTKISCLLTYFWLQKKNQHLFGLISLEHEWYIHKNDYLTLVDSDHNCSLQEQIIFAISRYQSHLHRIKLLLRNYFRKQVEFDKHNARLKNVMNYVFERGFRLREMDDAVLNKRQKLIMYIIQHKGFIATKELINEFDCNRKTIQRDFNDLLDQNLVKVIGQGAGVKYAVNIQERKHDYLQAYQANFLKDDTSLWD
jgi:Fic family protein